VRFAAELVTDPAELLTVTVYRSPLFWAVVAAIVYVEPAAPAIAEPFRDHWYMSGAVPVADTLNETLAPRFTD